MNDAFANAAGASVPDVALLVAGIGCVVVLLWAGWAMLSTWYGWAQTNVAGDQFQRGMVRIVLLTVVILWVLV